MVLWFATFLLAAVFCCSARRITRGTEKVEAREEKGLERMSRESNNEIDLEKAALQDELASESDLEEEKKKKKMMKL